MHQHATIVAGLLCSKFNYITNELELGTLTLNDFRSDGVIKSYKDPGITVEEHLNRIIKGEVEVPMLTNEFPLSAYIPKQIMNEDQDTDTFINAAICQSKWTSNFKRNSATMTLQKCTSSWLETTLIHSTVEARNCPKYQPVLKKGHNIRPQMDCMVDSFKSAMFKSEHNDQHIYWYPNCLKSLEWDAYIVNPFDQLTRKAFLKTITFKCMEDKKKSTMTPPYAIQLDSLTSDVGPVDANQGSMRKADARHYNAYLIIPGIVYHMASKIKNKRVNDLFGNDTEEGMINFIARYGAQARTKPYVKIHGAYTHYFTELKDLTYINECTGEFEIIPVTIFLVMLYNACFMFQNNKTTNTLITALDTLDLGNDVDCVKFMNTMSESKKLRQIPNWKTLFQKPKEIRQIPNWKTLFQSVTENTNNILNINVSVVSVFYRCDIMVYFRCGSHHINFPYCKKDNPRR
jgi:hypothetical protein